MDTIPDQPPGNQPIPPQNPPQKKAMPVLAWVGIGCGGLLLIAIIAIVFVFKTFKGKYDDFVANPEKAAAELVVSMNPELELVSQDEATGEMTIRTKSGEELTLSYGDIAEGRITVKDQDGNVTALGSNDISRVPNWVPLPPDFSDGVSTFHTETGDGLLGQVSGKTSLSVAEAEEFIATEFASAGGGSPSSSNRTSVRTGNTMVNTLNYKAGRRSLEVVITQKDGGFTALNFNYSEKK